ncbi:MAG: hypothetical protein OEQ53_01920 [Saprospiraceae bacterium]|nr:hypothetical protein [Saprospiraceae bacterium]
MKNIRGVPAWIFIMIGVPLFGQTVTVSDELNLKSEFVYDVLGKYDNDILLVRDGINEFDVQCFDKDMFMSWTIEENLDSRRSRIIDIVSREKGFNVIYSDEWKDTLMVKSRFYDPRARLEYTDTVAVYKRGLIRPKFRFVKSEDRNLFLMTEVENERIISAFAYDFNGRQVLWQSQFDFSDINFREDYRKTILTNNGLLFLIFEKDNYRFRKEDHSIEIFRFDQDRNQFDLVSFPLPEFTTYDAFFKYDNLNQQLTLVGLYSDRNTGTTDGIFHITVKGEDFNVHNVATVSYNDELLADFHGKYNPKKESLQNLDVQDLIFREDGGILLIVEENKEYERLSYGSRRDYYGSTRFSVDYYYEDIVLISIHPDGNSHWQKLLPKRQYSNDDDAAFSSYFLFSNPAHIRILYNDEIRNENTVSEYILNASGDITRRSLMSTDNQKLKLQIKNAVQVSANELVIPSVRGKRLKLVRLRY